MERIVGWPIFAGHAARGSLFARLVDGVVKADAAYRARDAFAKLDDAARRDIGLAPKVGSDWDAPTLMRTPW